MTSEKTNSRERRRILRACIPELKTSIQERFDEGIPYTQMIGICVETGKPEHIKIIEMIDPEGEWDHLDTGEVLVDVVDKEKIDLELILNLIPLHERHRLKKYSGVVPVCVLCNDFVYITEMA